jgi:hypothetical protein
MTTSFDAIYKKMAPASDDAGHLPDSAIQFDPAKHVSPLVAHELNNILAIVQGYADRLLLKYANDPTLTSELKSITEAARRAALIIRDATPQTLAKPIRQIPQPEHEPEPSLAN